MECREKNSYDAGTNTDVISFVDTNDNATPWKLYNQLIACIPEDIRVTDYCLGTNWSYLEAECGMGVSYTCRGGAKRNHTHDLRGSQLKDVAELSKSWCFEEASLGIAALNAWHSQRALLDPLGAIYDVPLNLPDHNHRAMDAFEVYIPRMTNKKVTVVGHFPHVDRIGDVAELTVLERSCTQRLDTPDPACEYVLPLQDFVFITGVTLINKTAPRLLDLSTNATTIMVGPSVVASPILFERGVETIAGSVVADPELVKFTIASGAGKLFGEALQMMTLTQG